MIQIRTFIFYLVTYTQHHNTKAAEERLGNRFFTFTQPRRKPLMFTFVLADRTLHILTFPFTYDLLIIL
jgi:hypothetical protein